MRGIVTILKEDVLEQIVNDYLKFSGYFTVHSVSFRPRKNHPAYVAAHDSVSSDVDVVAYHPQKAGLVRGMVVSCKAWQDTVVARSRTVIHHSF
jgi:hypothetical protein